MYATHNTETRRITVRDDDGQALDSFLDQQEMGSSTTLAEVLQSRGYRMTSTWSQPTEQVWIVGVAASQAVH